MLAALTAVSRLYLYVHFPLDVLAAAVLGIAIGLAAWPMTPLTAYGLFHLLFLILGLSGSALAAYMMRRCGAVCCRRILLGVGLFLLICYETYKLLFYYKGARPFVEVPASCIARSII